MLKLKVIDGFSIKKNKVHKFKKTLKTLSSLSSKNAREKRRYLSIYAAAIPAKV